MTNAPDRQTFAIQTPCKIRYADTDRQGHVNSAVFSVFLEVGRSEIIYNPDDPLAGPGTECVIAQMVLDFRGEIIWPGSVDICTRVVSMGTSSFKLEQALFQGDRCVATASTAIVLLNTATRKSTPIPEAMAHKLRKLM